MPRLKSSSTSTICASGAYASDDAPSIGRRITHATHPSTTSLSTFNSLKPQNLLIPRIRILLAPYMSPFVVPMHKVESWELLHKTLQSLFGIDISNPSIRITDHQGNSILPCVWKDLLEPDVTIIVDTCSLQAENAPVILTPKISTFNSPPISPKYTIRESEESFYDNISTPITPRGVIGQAVPMMPPSPMTPRGIYKVQSRKSSMRKANGSTRNGEEEKRMTSVSMFTGTGPNPSEKKEEQLTQSKTVGNLVQKAQVRNADALDNKSKSKNFKSAVSRFARALLCVLSAGTIQSSKGGEKGPGRLKRGPEKPRRTITMEAIENNPGKARSNISIHRIPSDRQSISISRRRGIPSLPPVVPRTTPIQNYQNTDKTIMIPSELASIKTDPCRSKSLANLRLTSTITSMKTAPSTAVSPADSVKRRPRSKSFTYPRNSKVSVISPPIPQRRPSLELGTNAQYKNLNMDKEAIQEIFNDIDGATLGSGSRSRSGTGETTSTTISLSPTLVSFDKPLPKLPFKFSAFPTLSPPRSPSAMTGWDKGVLRPMSPSSNEGYGRPSTAITRKITKVTLRKAVSTDFNTKKGMASQLV